MKRKRDSEICTAEYEVFLSFRGPDTRQGFADVLYNFMVDAGIRVFRDDDELPAGEKIGAILEAVTKSRLCVPIFSANYASSVWCLREVAAMVENGKEIVPIFYDVTPDDVKLKTSLYTSDLNNHEQEKGKEEVDNWKKALLEAASIKGRELKSTGYYAFVKQFVKELLIKLKVNYKHVTEHLVGMDGQIEATMNLLDVELPSVRVLGIHGMGGIGKTTLAKVIYNQISAKFSSCCFLSDIRESLSRNGMGVMQKQLLSSLDPKLKDCTDVDPVRLMQEKFKQTKVLIVLDDVDKKSQIKNLVGREIWFGPGSRIIVTTRDTSVLNLEHGTFDDIHIQEMKGLNSEHALHLFSRHAFGEASPPQNFKCHSHEVVLSAAGLPLALEVIGSLLHRRTELVWIDTIQKLKRVPHGEVLDQLKISYDALESEQKQIFLDIACFLINTEKTNAVYMWQSCGFYPELGIDALVTMSLVKILENGNFWMHDQLRDLGREIVRRENSNNLHCSRVWRHEEAMELLLSKEMRRNLQALSLEEPCEITLTEKELAGFVNLRFLKLKGANFQGDYMHLLQNLIWLSWQSCPALLEATNMHLKKLVILDLSNSLINQTWGGWNQIQIMRSLKVLDVTSCDNLTTSPCFLEGLVLEKLVLDNCKNLIRIHNSIGYLSKLKVLFLRGCVRMQRLPDSVGGLISLEEFDLANSGIVELPNSIGGLLKLERLCLLRCSGLNCLPLSVGKLKCLVELDLAFSGVVELPHSIEGLLKLKRLNVPNCFRLKVLPNSIGDLNLLTELDLSHASIHELPPTIRQLSLLKALILSSCHMLQELPVLLPPGLSKLIIHCKSLNKVPDLSRLDKLVHLVMEEFMSKHDGDPTEIPMLSKHLVDLNLSLSNITALPMNFNELSELKILKIACPKLKAMPMLPPNVSTLVLKYVNRETSLLSLSHMKSLLSLHLSGEMQRLHLPESLNKVMIQYGGCLEELSDLSGLGNLKELVLIDCPVLTEIPGLGKLSKLNKLQIKFCHSLEQLDNLSKLTQLSSIYIEGCSKLRFIEGSDFLTVDYYMQNCCYKMKKYECVGVFRGSNLHAWTPPPSGWFKWNICGEKNYVNRPFFIIPKTIAGSGETTNPRVGGVLRNINGRLMSMFLSSCQGEDEYPIKSNKEATVKAARKAMEISAAESSSGILQNTCIIIETESYEVFKWLSKQEPCPSPLNHHLDAIWSLMDSFNQVEFRVATKEANSMASLLVRAYFDVRPRSVVRWGVDKVDNVSWFHHH